LLAIVFKQDNPDFPRDIWTAEILPIPGPEGGGHADGPIGSGPFKFGYRKEERAVGLVANEKYYRGRPPLDGVVFTFQPDKEKSWARLLSGKTDLVTGIHSQDYEIMKHYRNRFLFSTTPDPSLTVLLYNTHHPLFMDPRVRMAFAHAIDTTYIRDVILRGMGVVPAGMMGFYSSFRNLELKPVSFDPEKAVHLLEEAGWTYDRESRCLFKNGKPFEFTLFLFRENQFHQRLGQYLRLCLNDLGIKVHVRPVPFEELGQCYWHNDDFDAVVTDLVDILAKDIYLLELWCPLEGRKAGAGCFEDPRVTALILQAIREREPTSKRRILWEVDSLLTSLQPATPLCQRASLNALSRRFQFPHSFSWIYARFHFWKISPSAR